MLRVSIPVPVEADAVRVARIHNEILEKVAALPGVESAALVSSAPLERFDSNDPVSAEDKVYAPTEIPPIRRFKFVSPGYFQTVGTPLIVGRDITWTDVFDERRVTMISENMAREMWGSAPAALGKRIRASGIDDWREIIGVVGDVHDNGVHEPAPGDRVLAHHDAEVLGQRAIRLAIVDLCRAQRSHEHRGVPHADPGSRLVGQCQPPDRASCGRCRMSTSDRWRGRRSRW